MSRALLALVVLASAVTLAVPASAQTAAPFPDRPVRIIVPNPPGGGMDVLTRILSKRLGEILGQPVVVENRAGAQGGLGIGVALKSKPDGYTIAALPGDTMVINPHIYGDTGWNTLTDLAPVSRAITHPMVMTANPAVPVRTMKDVENYARANPGKLTYATSGAQPQVMGEYFKVLTKTDLLHVRFNGSGPAALAVIGGTTDLMISSGAGSIPHVNGGKLRAIAVLGRERSEALPDTPNAAEAGYPELADLIQWYGYGVPAGTPAAIVAKLNAAFVQALQDPDVQKNIRAAGMTPAPSTPEEFAQVIKVDYERWGRIVKQTGVKPE